MGEVVNLGTPQNDTVRCFRNALDRAVDGKVKIALVLTMDHDLTVAYSRAGVLSSAGEMISLIGSLEHQKAALMEHLMNFDDATAAKAAAEEDNESPDPS